MLEREMTRQSIAWVRDQFKLDNIDLNPSYQRNSVWSLSYQQYLIDSILRNFPIPAVLVAEEIQQDGRVRYHVVDGKQRLTAIQEFLADVFPVGKDSDEKIQKKYFSELDQELKVRFLGYRLTFEAFKQVDAAGVAVREIYDRFNRNVVALNAQELRKARFQGEFTKKMEELADGLSENEFWAELKLFTRNQIRRMLDVQYVSELYMLTERGIEEQDDQSIDQYYADHDDDVPEYRKVMKQFERILNELKALADAGLSFKETRFRNLTDFYSLWAAIRLSLEDHDQLDYKKTARKLTAFSSDVAAAAPSYEGSEVPSKAGVEYSDAVRQGVNKKANREIRALVLRKQFNLNK